MIKGEKYCKVVGGVTGSSTAQPSGQWKFVVMLCLLEVKITKLLHVKCLCLSIDGRE